MLPSSTTRYIGPDGVDYRSRWIYVTISSVLILSLCNLIDYIVRIDVNAFGPTEFLINYEGGYVRRGLLGELLYIICKSTGLNPLNLIRLISLSAYLFVGIFFLSKFRRDGYSWWFLCSPLAVGLMSYLIRKDYLEYTILIGILYLMRNISATTFHKLVASMLAILGLYMHEAFMFWGIPIFLLLLWSDHKSRRIKLFNLFVTLAIFGLFGLQCYYKGDQTVSRAIVDSWNGICSGQFLEYTQANSIGALGWNTSDTIRYHVQLNISGSESLYPIGIIWQLIYLIAAYYFCSNFIFVFHISNLTDVQDRKLAFSSVYLMTLVTMLPMFLFLSCDYARLYQYVTIVAMASLVILQHKRLLSLFPEWYIRRVEMLNVTICRLLPPKKSWMVILLLFLAVSPTHFSLGWNLQQSAMGQAIEFFFRIVRPIYRLIIGLW